jgi:hypothetical protein
MFKRNRALERKPLSKLGFIQIFGDDGGQILNISEAGLCFATFAPVGHVRNIQFWFSLNLRDRIEATGEVAWLDAETKAGGLRFLNLSERALKHIRAYATVSPFREPREKGKFFAAALAKLDSERFAVKSEDIPSDPASGAMGRTESSPAFRLLDQPAGNESSVHTSMESTDLISLQRHLAVSRRNLYLGIVLGALFASFVAIPIAGYFGGRNRIESSSSAPVATAAQESAASEVPPVQADPSAASNPSQQNISAPLNTQRSTATHSYPGSSVSGSPKNISSVSSSPFGSRNSGIISQSVQPRSGSANGVKKSTATPQQLWTAVQAGDANAAVLLADRYLRGDGVPTNCVQARVLLLAASEKKNPAAIKKLHELDETGCS